MRAYIFLLTLMCAISANAQLLQPLPSNINKRVLIAHPTISNLEVIHALYNKDLLDLQAIELIGIYHKDEVYDYSKSISMLDTMDYLNIKLIEFSDTLYVDSLYCMNACSAHFKQLFNESEGVIFFGGPDIPPVLYKEETHPATIVTDPYRHYFEASFLYHLLGGYQNNDYKGLLEENSNYFIFGICLGMQTMNIATGGTLIQDIPSEIFSSNESKGLQHLNQNEIHRNFYPKMSHHKNKGLAGSYFHNVTFKDYFFPDLVEVDPNIQPLVNSYHHQAVEKLGKGFKVGATSTDGKIIEAVFHAHYPNVFAVQFHPERSQFYLNTKQYQFSPQSEKCYLSDCIDEKSMAFHINFWQAINNLIQEL